MRRVLAVVAMLVAIVAVAITAAAILTTSTAQRSIPLTQRTARTRAPASVPAGASEGRLSLGAVQSAFLESYGAYLDGAPLSVLRGASVTASWQARSGGRIPRAFRDGPLRVAQASTDAGPYSAQAAVVLANREERYPLELQFLREQHGWMLAQLTPPDLTMDETITPVTGARIPATAQRATRRFALAYAAYRAHVGPLPTGMTAGAAAAIRTGEDSLAGLRFARTLPRLVSLAYGPVNAGELAATATVRFGESVEQFSLLMALRTQTGGWLCAAFL